ncbi:H-NS histone family protein [Trinickia sp. NRRL B-1857]
MNARIDVAMQAERAQAISTIRELMEQFGITARDLAAKRGPRTQGPLSVKYRDPKTGATWSGRGREPRWIAGKDRRAFAI